MKDEEKLKSILVDLGLTELQIRAYLVILKANGIKISTLAKQIAVNRPNTYTLIERLKEFELIHEENLVTGKIIYASDHHNIIEKLKQINKKFEKDIIQVQSLDSYFKLIKANSNNYLPKVRTFETKYSLDTIADDILSSSKGKEILLFSNQKIEKQFFSKKMHENFVKTRVKNKTNIRVLVIDNFDGTALRSHDKGLLRETRILPEEIEFSSEIYIYENKIAMIDIKEEVIGIIIENEELFNVHKQLFELIWSFSK